MNSKKKRVVAVILYKNGNIVQSKHFNRHKIVGSPFTIIDRLSRWNADEVIYLNIRPKNNYQIRKDLNFKMSNSFDDVIKEVSKRAFMPITVGGGISSLKEVDNYFKLGADKISINTSLLKMFSKPNQI